MKEGYIQLKLAEITDKCKEFEQIIKMEKSKIELLEQRIGGFKDLIKKLEDLDAFKDNILKNIKNDNQNLLESEINSISNKVAKDIEKKIILKLKDLENTIENIKVKEKKLDSQIETITELNRNINFLMTHNELLMMKLVNKAVISDREVNELNMRSMKKSNP